MKRNSVSIYVFFIAPLFSLSIFSRYKYPQINVFKQIHLSQHAEEHIFSFAHHAPQQTSCFRRLHHSTMRHTIFTLLAKTLFLRKIRTIKHIMQPSLTYGNSHHQALFEHHNSEHPFFPYLAPTPVVEQKVIIKAFDTSDKQQNYHHTIISSSGFTAEHVPPEVLELLNTVGKTYVSEQAYDVIRNWGLQHIINNANVEELTVEMHLRRDDRKEMHQNLPIETEITQKGDSTAARNNKEKYALIVDTEIKKTTDNYGHEQESHLSITFKREPYDTPPNESDTPEQLPDETPPDDSRDEKEKKININFDNHLRNLNDFNNVHRYYKITLPLYFWSAINSNERLQRQIQRDKKMARHIMNDLQFATLLEQQPDLSRKFLHSLQTTITKFFAAFSEKNSNQLIDRHKARQKLFNLEWPEDLPVTTHVYEEFYHLKERLLQCEHYPNGELKSLTSHKEKQGLAHAQIIHQFLKRVLNERSYHTIMQQQIAEESIPYLNEVYNRQLEHDNQGGLTRTLHFCKTLASEPMYLLFDGIDYLINGSDKTMQNIQKNSVMNDIDELIHFLDHGDYINAFRMCERHQGTEIYNDMHQMTQERFRKTHNACGIPRLFARDPYLRTYPAEKIHSFRNNLPGYNTDKNFSGPKLRELHELNNKLARRYVIKEILAQKIGSSQSNRPDYINELLYSLVDCCEQKIDVPGIMDKLSHLSADSKNIKDRQAYHLFFNADGTCKLFTDGKLTKNANIDKRINDIENTHARTLLNYFASLEPENEHKQITIQNGIDACYKSCNPEHRDTYLQLAASSFNTFNNPDHPFSKCGNFAENVPSDTQHHLQNLIADAAVNSINTGNTSSAADQANALTQLALAETARQLNSEGDLNNAAQMLNILKNIQTNGMHGTLRLISEENTISPDGTTIEIKEVFTWESDQQPTQPPEFDRQKPEPSQNISNLPPPTTQKPEPTQQTPHEDASHTGRFTKSIEKLQSLSDFSHYLSPDLQKSLNRFNEIARHLNAHQDPLHSNQISNLHLASDLIKRSQNNTEALNRIQKQINKKIDHLISTIANQIIESDPETFEEILETITASNTQLKSKEARSTIKQLCESARWLYNEGFTEAGKGLASFALRMCTCSQAFIKGIGEGIVSAYSSMLHMMFHPITTLKGLSTMTIGLIKILEYGYIRQSVLEHALKKNCSEEEFEKMWQEAHLPEHVRETERNFKEISSAILKELDNFLQHATLEDWSQLSGRLLGEWLGWKFDLGVLGRKANEITGASNRITALLDDAAQALVKGGLNDRLIASLEECGATIEEIETLHSSWQTGPPGNFRKKLSEVTVTASERVSTAEKILAPATVAEEIKSITAAGESIEPFLEKIGHNLAHHGPPQGIKNVEKYRKKLKQSILGQVGNEEIATKKTEIIIEHAYNEALAINKNNKKASNLPDLAKEMGKTNAARAKRGEKIDLSKYTMTSEEREILEKGLESFGNIEGAGGKDGPITRILKNSIEGDGRGGSKSSSKGSLHEIREGLELQKEGEKVIDFDKIYGEGGSKKNAREFDIETETKLIECKDTKWPDLKNLEKLSGPEKEIVSRLQSNIPLQNKIALSMGKEFEVRSAQPIPQEWKNFFIEKNIKFIERNTK